jgi:hypothetical protein
MSEKPKRKRSPKHRLTLPDWRWRLLILAAMYGFILLPSLITVPKNMLIAGLVSLAIATIIPFGMGYTLGWTKHISNVFTGCVVFVAFFVFTITAGFYLILPYLVWLASSSSDFSLSMATRLGTLLLSMPLAIHIGMAGEQLAIRNYQRHNQPKPKREYVSSEQLSDEYGADDDDSFDIGESNEEQQKFDSLEG